MTELSQAIAQRQTGREVAQGPKTMEAALAAMKGEFAKVLPAVLPPETFLRLALNELRATPKLAECTVPSFMGALMLGARLGLEPGGPLGQLYLTPRNLKLPGTGTRNVPAQYAMQVVPIIGYRGLRDLAIRSGRVDSIQSFIIREGDRFHYGSNEERGVWHTWEPLDSDEDESEREWRGVLTVAQLGVGKKPVWRYLSKQAVLRRKASGDAGDRGPWKDFEEAMVRKTGVRAIANDLPSSSILIEAVRNDERVMLWRQGDEQPVQQQQLEQRANDADGEQPPQAAEPNPEVKGQSSGEPQEQQQPSEQQRGRRGGKREQYAPPPPDSPPMDDYPIQDPPEDGQ
jgi:recombination protein RecT